ncbi:MAG TPA: hypothetical protein VF912_12240 [Anaeromyxobacter sp.]
MATDHTGKNMHQRAGRVPPHGPGERIIEATGPSDQEPADESLRRDPPTEYKREGTDVPGVKKKIR